MYKRYYDGYSTDYGLHNPGNNSSDIIYNKADETSIAEVSDSACEPLTTDIASSGSVSASGYSAFNFGGLQTDDLILLGLLILFLFDSDNIDTTLLIIIGVIFIAGLNF